MLGLIVTWLIAGLMLIGWLAWLVGLVLAGQLHRLTRPPHGARCACPDCVREIERLAKLPTPRPLPRTAFRNGRAWRAFQHRRDALIARKRHYGLSEAQIDPYAPIDDPEPRWEQPEADRFQARLQARLAARQDARQRAVLLDKLRHGQELTDDELSTWRHRR